MPRRCRSEFGRPRRARFRSGSRGRGPIPKAARRFGRCPCGSRTASGSPPSRRPPAARWRRRLRSVLSEIAKVTVPPSPPLSVRAMTKRSMCRCSSGTPASVQTCLDRVEHGGRTARPGGPVLPVRDDVVERREVEVAHVVGQLQVQPVVRADLRARSRSSSWKITSLRRRRGVDVHDVGRLARVAPATAASP